MNTKAVRGMRDFLPEEVRLRTYLLDVIRKTYQKAGFLEIETPKLESYDRLIQSEGGDNLSLLYPVMKRGDKLNKALLSGRKEDLIDSGLRYDLTLPLSRYYSEHRSQLPHPFKVMQLGEVYRAERPQRGRYRALMQCDIDIIGLEDSLAEMELILTTTNVLKKLGFTDYEILVNDRRLLAFLAEYCGIEQSKRPGLFITLDKMDKIGLSGVKEALVDQFSSQELERLMPLLDSQLTLTRVKELGGPVDLLDQIEEIIEVTGGKFAPFLVRGMGYYTGTIFEIHTKTFGGAVAGGGRYDKMIGKFLGQNIPAVGFSIGYERIALLLSEQGFEPPREGLRKALLYGEEEGKMALSYVQPLRDQGEEIALMPRASKFGKQLARLAKEGYDQVIYRQADAWLVKDLGGDVL